MRNEIDRIADQIHRSRCGDAWHGPNLFEVLQGVDAAMASERPIAGAHTIAELVAHLECTHRVVLERAEGRGRLTTNDEEWPPVPSPISADQWADRLRRLADATAALERAVKALPADGLDEPFVPGGSPAYNNLIGHLQHDAYHAGQIALLKRLIRRTT